MNTTFNFNDPRVRRRAASALAFVTTYTNAITPKSLSTRLIDQHLGQSQHPLSKYLRSLLLIEHDGHWNMMTGKTKQYLRNEAGCKELQLYLDPNTDYSSTAESLVSAHVEQYSEELTTGRFKYKDASNRHWHPLQNIPSETRRRELSRYGYSHIYDIKCAAPSIILHLARDIGVKLKHTSTIEDYITNRCEIRSKLSRDLQLSVSNTKRLLNMLFNGAPVGFNGDLATTRLLRGDTRAINAVKAHPYIQALRSEITYIWRRISNHQIDGEYVIPRKYHSDGKKKRISGSDRWQLYFVYERRVMDVVTAYLDRQCARYLIEHDGWSSNIQVDLSDLTDHVRSASGIDTIEFEYECYTCSTNTAC